MEEGRRCLERSEVGEKEEERNFQICCIAKKGRESTNTSHRNMFLHTYSHSDGMYMFRIARAGIFPRSSLLGAGSWGSGNLERVGQLGEGWGK